MENHDEFTALLEPKESQDARVIDKVELIRDALKTEETTDFFLEALIDWKKT